MLKRIDYDDRQHIGYKAGRDMGRANAMHWMRVFEAHAPVHRPLSVLDLGSGSGRFTGALAETFEDSVLGVEPSGKMRHIATRNKDDPRVRFAAGRAEAIPAPEEAFDIVLMFLSFHHVVDRPKAAAEIARVLKPGGRVMLRSQFSDRFPALDWHAFFPRARAIELEMFPALSDVETLFAAEGLRRVALVESQEHFANSLAEHATLLRHRAISTFEHMDEAEIAEGFARLDVAVAAEQSPRAVTARGDLLVLQFDQGNGKRPSNVKINTA